MRKFPFSPSLPTVAAFSVKRQMVHLPSLVLYLPQHLHVCSTRVGEEYGMGGISILQRPAEETCPEVRIARKFWIFSQWTLLRSGQSKAFVLRKGPALCGPEVFPRLCSQGQVLKQVAASTGDTFSMRQESLLKQVAAPTGDMFLTRRGPLLKQVAAPQVIRSQPGDTTHAWEQRPQTVPLLRVLT